LRSRGARATLRSNKRRHCLTLALKVHPKAIRGTIGILYILSNISKDGRALSTYVQKNVKSLCMASDVGGRPRDFSKREQDALSAGQTPPSRSSAILKIKRPHVARQLSMVLRCCLSNQVLRHMLCSSLQIDRIKAPNSSQTTNVPLPKQYRFHCELQRLHMLSGQAHSAQAPADVPLYLADKDLSVRLVGI